MRRVGIGFRVKESGLHSPTLSTALTLAGSALLVVASALIAGWLLTASVLPLWPAALLLVLAAVITGLGLLMLTVDRIWGRSVRNRLGVAFMLIVMAGLACASAAYVLRFDRTPPTYLNLVLWVPPSGHACIEQAVKVEDIPAFGTGISVDDMCPDSQHAP